MKLIQLFKNPYLWLLLIVLLALQLRLYKINSPIGDWHSWRQADTASVARHFYQHGYNPFIPKYDDMSGVAENPVPNVNRYRFVEFPISNTLVYIGYLLNGGVDVKIARFVSVLFSLGSTILIFFITRRYFNSLQGLLASFLYAVLPYNIFYSRVVLPEPALVFFSLGMLYFTDRWIFENKKWLFALGVLFTSAAFLTKPFAGFYALPLLYSFFQKEKRIWPIPKRYFLFGVVSLSPFIAWRLWMKNFPEGIPASNWLFNGTMIRFRPAFFRWIIVDRFGREILSAVGIGLMLLGVLLKPRVKEGWQLHLLFLGMLIYLIVVATGNVQHDYYQYLIIPAVVIMVARGIYLLLTGIKDFLPKIITIPLVAGLLGLSLFFTWYEIRGLYQINNGIILEAGDEANKILPKDAIVLAPYNGDTSFLYAVNRPGFPFIYQPIDAMISDFGVTHYVSVTNDAKTAWVKRKYTPIFDNGRFYIIDLTKINPTFDRLNDNNEPL